MEYRELKSEKKIHTMSIIQAPSVTMVASVAASVINIVPAREYAAPHEPNRTARAERPPAEWT